MATGKDVVKRTSEICMKSAYNEPYYVLKFDSIQRLFEVR